METTAPAQRLAVYGGEPMEVPDEHTGGPIRENIRTLAAKNGSRLSRFVFTLNNYTPTEYSWFTDTYCHTVKWIIVAIPITSK